MAGNFNKVILVGNITRDIELRHTGNNQPLAKFGIACNRRWRSADGEQRDEVMFIDCEAWGKTAEMINQYFSKGRPILIEGRLKLDQWEDKETKAKRSKHVVVIEGFSFVDSKPGGNAEGGASNRAPRPAAAPSGAPAQGGSDEWGGKGPMGEEDIPF